MKTRFSWFIGGWVLALLTLVIWMPKQAEASCETPVLHIVMDNSGSMGSNNKWNDAVRAANTVTSNYRGKLFFGLEIFNSSASVIYGIDSCMRDGNSCVSNLQRSLGTRRPGGGTNLVAAITVARTHILQVRNIDRVKNRKNSILFITDGQAPCADSQVSSLRSTYNVDTYIIGFGSGVDRNCLNRMAVAGGTAKSGTTRYYQANNSNDLNAAMKAIANAASKEICNNLDDDCDGLVDEDLKRNCQGSCGTGTQICNRGKWGVCSTSRQPSPEVCNNIDDDCNGRVDDGLTRPCSNQCGKGNETCVRGKWANCTAPKTRPEDCNAKDDDCDGQVDEDLRKSCNGPCGAGTKVCVAGDWGPCSTPQPSQEICDGRDNDCDGRVDNGATCPNGVCKNGRCYRKCTTECGRGQVCQNGLCVDKPCNPACQGGQICRRGTCVVDDCTQASAKCGSDEVCANKKCVRNLCTGVKCAANQFCDPTTGKCRHSCANVKCTPGKICKDGACFGEPCGGNCKSGETCVNNQCQANQCAQGCPSGFRCKGTQCVQNPCSYLTCPSGQVCVDGDCYDKNGSNNPGNPNKPKPDGNTNPGTDGGNTNPGTDGGNAGSADGGSTGGTGADENGGGGGRRGNTGCLCSSTHSAPSLPVTFLLVFAGLFWFRRRQK